MSWQFKLLLFVSVFKDVRSWCGNSLSLLFWPNKDPGWSSLWSQAKTNDKEVMFRQTMCQSSALGQRRMATSKCVTSLVHDVNNFTLTNCHCHLNQFKVSESEWKSLSWHLKLNETEFAYRLSLNNSLLFSSTAVNYYYNDQIFFYSSAPSNVVVV